MNNIITSIIFISLFLSPQLHSMQPDIREQKNLRKIVQENYAQFRKRLQSIWEKKDYTQEELNRIRIGAVAIIAGLLLIGGGGVRFVSKTAWWKKRKRLAGLAQLLDEESFQSITK